MANTDINDNSLNVLLRNNYSVWTEEGPRNVKVYLCTTKNEAIKFLNSFKLSTGFVMDKYLKNELHTNAKTFLFNRTKDYIRSKISERKWKLEQSIEEEENEKKRKREEQLQKEQEERDSNPYRMWVFNMRDTFNTEVKSTEFSLEIGNIANKIQDLVSAINGDVSSIFKLFKEAKMEFTSSSSSSDGEKMITKKNEENEYIFIKYKTTTRFKKRKMTGLLGFTKELKRIEGEYSIMKPNNASARVWCEKLMDKKIVSLENHIL
jgi:hypothetical protein